MPVRRPRASIAIPVAKIPTVEATSTGRDDEPHQRVRRPLDDVRAPALVVAGEPVAGAAELERDRRDEQHPDEHVHGEQRAQEQDRHALDREQGRAGRPRSSRSAARCPRRLPRATRRLHGRRRAAPDEPADEARSSRAHPPARQCAHAGAGRRGRAEDGGPARAGPARGRTCGRRRRNRRGCALDGPRGRLRRDRARRDAPRPRRVRHLPRAPLRGSLDAGADADRPRRGRGPDRRARRGRRRLPAQAVLVRRAARAAAGARAARARPSVRRQSRSARSGSTRPPAGPGAARRSSSCRRRSSRCSRPSCAGPGEVLSRGQLLDAAWDLAFESRSNIVDVYVRYLREKIGSATRSRPSAASATGCARTRG